MNSPKTEAPPEINILLVDDEEKLLDSMAFRLKREGYSVTIANNGAQAKLKIDGHHYQMIVTDLQMPKMSGERFIQAIRTSKQNRITPVIVISGHLDHPKVIELKDDACRLLVKPFEFATLLETIQKMLPKVPR